MSRINIATIEVFAENETYAAEYSDEVGIKGFSTGCAFLKEAVVACVADGQKCYHDEALLEAAVLLREQEED